MSDYFATPEERHEVAERLRNLTPSKQVHPDYTPWYTDICGAIGGEKEKWLGRRRGHQWRGLRLCVQRVWVVRRCDRA